MTASPYSTFSPFDHPLPYIGPEGQAHVLDLSSATSQTLRDDPNPPYDLYHWLDGPITTYDPAFVDPSTFVPLPPTLKRSFDSFDSSVDGQSSVGTDSASASTTPSSKRQRLSEDEVANVPEPSTSQPKPPRRKKYAKKADGGKGRPGPPAKPASLSAFKTAEQSNAVLRAMGFVSARQWTRSLFPIKSARTSMGDGKHVPIKHMKCIGCPEADGPQLRRHLYFGTEHLPVRKEVPIDGVMTVVWEIAGFNLLIQIYALFAGIPFNLDVLHDQMDKLDVPEDLRQAAFALEDDFYKDYPGLDANGADSFTFESDHGKFAPIKPLLNWWFEHLYQSRKCRYCPDTDRDRTVLARPDARKRHELKCPYKKSMDMWNRNPQDSLVASIEDATSSASQFIPQPVVVSETSQSNMTAFNSNFASGGASTSYAPNQSMPSFDVTGLVPTPPLGQSPPTTFQNPYWPGQFASSSQGVGIPPVPVRASLLAPAQVPPKPRKVRALPKKKAVAAGGSIEQAAEPMAPVASGSGASRV